jgi:ankyrin repeat protein
MSITDDYEAVFCFLLNDEAYTYDWSRVMDVGLGRRDPPNDSPLETLLRSGVDPNQQDAKGIKPLYYAVLARNRSHIETLLKYGAKLDGVEHFLRNESTASNQTQSASVAEPSDLEIVALLLDHGADVNRRLRSGRQPLDWAVRNGYVELARVLLERGAEAEIYKWHYPVWRWKQLRSPLSLAAEKDMLEMARLLLRYGSDVDGVDPTERTPLSWAAAAGSLEMMSLLLDHGANIDRCSRKYGTVLRFAVITSQVAIVRFLLDRWATADQVDHFGRSPISYAAGYGNLQILDLLLERGASVHIWDDKHRTPLSYAAEEGHLVVVRRLLEHGARVDTEDWEYNTPISYATDKGHLAIISLLLEHGAIASPSKRHQQNLNTPPPRLSILDGDQPAEKISLKR